jgi:hypothetical protein
MTESPFDMAILFPQHTGLPFFVWISYRGNATNDDVRVKISRHAKGGPPEMIFGIRPDIHLVDGDMHAFHFHEILYLRNWIELNRATLISYWEGDIDTLDALDALTALP